jgi:hypothetical protein
VKLVSKKEVERRATYPYVKGKQVSVYDRKITIGTEGESVQLEA